MPKAMLLLQLPPEILTQIFCFCGSLYFQQDSRRLTISKRWFEFAFPVAWRDLTLSPKGLASLHDSKILMKRTSFRHYIQTLYLKLGGDREIPLVTEPIDEDDRIDFHGTRIPPMDPAWAWIPRMNSNIHALIFITGFGYRLHTLRLQSLPLPPPEELAYPELYLMPDTVRASITAYTLRHLVLDITQPFLPNRHDPEDKRHLCKFVARVLRNLQTVHLRLPHICPVALTPPPSHTALPLTDLVVNLSLYSDVPGITSAKHSSRCFPDQGGLAQPIRKQAEILTKRMESPKVVRVLTHLPVQFELRSFDVLTGKTMKLAMDAEWDDDGEVVEEDESEPEFTDSDANDSFFDEEEDNDDADGNNEE